jgi:colicin import membrane protein
MEMKTASIISTGLHAAVLAWALVSFSGETFNVTPAQSLPVDLVTDKQFSEITKGVKSAKPLDKAKVQIDKKDEPKPAPTEDIVAKLTPKKEIKTAKEDPTPPPQNDPIADKIKDEKPEKAEKPEAAAEPLPQKKPPPPHKQPKFEPDKIAALLDKRAPERNAVTGETPQEASLGMANGADARLSQSEIDAFRRRITQCWNVPAGAADAQNLSVVFRVQFRKDGTVVRGPDIVKATATSMGPVFAESGRRAILQCQPYTMLRQETYDSWKDMEIQFNPSDMFRG